MSENNAVTKEELKEVVAELRQEFRQGLAETNQNVLALRHKVDGLEHKVDGLEHKVDANDRKLEAFRAETLARFDAADNKHDEVVKMIFGLRSDMAAHHREYQETHSRLLTGMDKVMKELETHRIERMSLGDIQNRHGRDIETIKNNLGLKSNNGKRRESTSKKQPSKRNKKSK